MAADFSIIKDVFTFRCVGCSSSSSKLSLSESESSENSFFLPSNLTPSSDAAYYNVNSISLSNIGANSFPIAFARL